jgi:colanic acid biosynthesis glycosyl transferase WcaI
MVQKAKMKTRQPEKVFYFPNWVDTDFLSPGADAGLYRQRWPINESTRVVLYSGNIGMKQGLEVVLQAAEKLKGDPNLLFVLVGTGAAVKELKQLAKTMQLDNLKFYPLQPYEDLPALMALADIHLVVQKKGAADAVMPSKLTSIFAVGGECVITAEPHTELGQMCKKHPGIARCIEPENADALVEVLKDMLLVLPSKAQGLYNKIAYNFALDNLNKDKVLSSLVNKLELQENN